MYWLRTIRKSVNSNIEELKTNEILINRCLNKEYSGDGLCAAGRFSISIDPEGNIYPCHLFRLNDSFKMGNIYDKEKNIFNSLSYKKLKNQRKVLGCDECSARNICSQCFEKWYIRMMYWSLIVIKYVNLIDIILPVLTILI